MFQNISNVPVKQSFLMYDMLKAKIDRLAGKIILKKWPSKRPRITENIQVIPSESFYVSFMPILCQFYAFTKSAFF